MRQLQLVISIAMIVVGTFGMVLSLEYELSLNQCDAKARSVRHEYTLLGGCMVSPRDGVWLPLENYRYLPKHDQ